MRDLDPSTIAKHRSPSRLPIIGVIAVFVFVAGRWSRGSASTAALESNNIAATRPSKGPSTQIVYDRNPDPNGPGGALLNQAFGPPSHTPEATVVHPMNHDDGLRGEYDIPFDNASQASDFVITSVSNEKRMATYFQSFRRLGAGQYPAYLSMLSEARSEQRKHPGSKVFASLLTRLWTPNGFILGYGDHPEQSPREIPLSLDGEAGAISDRLIRQCCAKDGVYALEVLKK